MKAKPVPHETSVRVTAWAALGFTLVAAISARVHLAGLPLERDEGEYAYTGQLILRGIAPYRLAYSMKFPGTSASYAGLMSIFGQSAYGIHIGLVCVSLVTVGLLFFLGRRLLGNVGGTVTATSYAALSLMPQLLGQAAHATHFVVMFAVAGCLTLIRAIERRNRHLIFTSGCLFGLALLMKQPGLFFIIFGAIYLFIQDWRARLQAGEIFSRNLLFLFGASAPGVLTALILWGAGVFGKFWFWAIKYAVHYGSQVSLAEALQVFAEHFQGTFETAWPFWAISGIIGIGLVACAVKPSIRKHADFLVTLAFFSILAVAAGFYFRPHYFILVLPATSLLAGAVVIAAIDAFQTMAHAFRFLILLVFALLVLSPFWAERDFLFERQVEEANRMVNGTNPFPEAIKISDYIRENSNPGDTIAVLGSEPEIYFYSRRISATGYIYTYGLMEPQPYAHQMQDEMIREVETARPKFLVLVVVNKSWLVGPDSDQTIFRWADSYCDANYEEVGLVNISDAGTDYYFYTKPPDIKPTAEHILIYRRKT